MNHLGLRPVLLCLLLGCTERMELKDLEDATTADLLVLSSGGLLVSLLAVVVPNFMTMAVRAKRAECPANLSGIQSAQRVYHAENDTYLEVPIFHPDSTPGKYPRVFESGSGFDGLGWMPDGEVRGSYKVVRTSSDDFRITCIMDGDGDGEAATYTATRTIDPTRNTPNSVY